MPATQLPAGQCFRTVRRERPETVDRGFRGSRGYFSIRVIREIRG